LSVHGRAVRPSFRIWWAIRWVCTTEGSLFLCSSVKVWSAISSASFRRRGLFMRIPGIVRRMQRARPALRLQRLRPRAPSREQNPELGKLDGRLELLQFWKFIWLEYGITRDHKIYPSLAAKSPLSRRPNPR